MDSFTSFEQLLGEGQAKEKQVESLLLQLLKFNAELRACGTSNLHIELRDVMINSEEARFKLAQLRFGKGHEAGTTSSITKTGKKLLQLNGNKTFKKRIERLAQENDLAAEEQALLKDILRPGK